jgi:hypothetical protein
MAHLHTLHKIINPDLARAALHSAERFGEFQIIVRFARPEKHPSYMKVTGEHSAGHMKALIPCDQIDRLEDDRNVLSVELRQYISQPASS